MQSFEWCVFTKQIFTWFSNMLEGGWEWCSGCCVNLGGSGGGGGAGMGWHRFEAAYLLFEGALIAEGVVALWGKVAVRLRGFSCSARSCVLSRCGHSCHRCHSVCRWWRSGRCRLCGLAGSI